MRRKISILLVLCALLFLATTLYAEEKTLTIISSTSLEPGEEFYSEWVDVEGYEKMAFSSTVDYSNDPGSLSLIVADPSWGFNGTLNIYFFYRPTFAYSVGW